MLPLPLKHRLTTPRKVQYWDCPIKSVLLTSRISLLIVLPSHVANGKQFKIHAAALEIAQPSDRLRPPLPPHKPNSRGTTHGSLLTNHGLSNSKPGRL